MLPFTKHTARHIWEKGYGVIKHSTQTCKRVHQLVSYLTRHHIKGDGIEPYRLLAAADRLANAAMWLAVHQAYAQHIYLDGRPLTQADFKKDPQGHLGGTLNMIPAYVGYMLANALTGFTRGWVMEQGHAVAAIDSTNVLLNHMSDAHTARYNLSDQGLSRFAQDFYAYRLNEKGRQHSPLGSHVNPHTAGGHLEGGYLGFASLQYAHMPLPGESIVAFLSDGAFEEQRGTDWISHWWRAKDSGLIVPIMIANGRRIDQHTTLEQDGGALFFKKHLQLYHFDPLIFDGRDPAAFAWTILEQERRLKQASDAIHSSDHYPIHIPYGIAVAPKGAGFYNEGTIHAHNLPLVNNPSTDRIAADLFNKHSSTLFVPLTALNDSIRNFQQHHVSGRILEKDNPIAHRQVTAITSSDLHFLPSGETAPISPMDAIDDGFLATVTANPTLRPRVGNPDEIRSNRMRHTLKALKMRVPDATKEADESIMGSIITALNEEAVASAAFGNKGGINLIVTYEAFASKMFGQARQEVIFSKHKSEIGSPAGWLSVPIVLTSNTWENGKNELSHQDPSFAESMLAETSDISRVIFVPDFNSAVQTIKTVYTTHGQIWTLIVPKKQIPVQLNEEESIFLLQHGAIRMSKAQYQPNKASLALIAIGAYQLIETLKASERLIQHKIPHITLYIAEPGRFRLARNEGEEKHLSSTPIIKELLPDSVTRMILSSHTRPELMLGTLYPLCQHRQVSALGFINQGGTLNTDGMLFVNRCSWAHILKQAESLLGNKKPLLTESEADALAQKRSPDGVITMLCSK